MFLWLWLGFTGAVGFKLVRSWDGSTEGAIVSLSIMAALLLIFGIGWGWHYGRTGKLTLL
ncbi:hypothetical protein M527_12635 [Sphingobium indicum IP26]|nr:hypothetical protein M527_12635 [Sphingobium indicum IP26]